MNDIYLWIVTAVTAAVAINTLMRLWTGRHRLWQEDLRDEDRLFAWRVVLFLIYPALTLLDLRSTLIACQWFGGYIDNWTYGLFWYAAAPSGITSSTSMLIVLFAGVAVQCALALCVVPALFFRPHPFLSTVLAYAVVGILGINLVLEPVLSLVGMGGSRWHEAKLVASPTQMMYLLGIYAALAVIYALAISNRGTKIWFAKLSRPLIAEQLQDAQLQWKVDPQSAPTNARLAILYERAGLAKQAHTQFKRLEHLYPESIYTAFVDALLSYRSRKYSLSRRHFLRAADSPVVDPPLRGVLLSAAACAAFAEGDLEGALNLSERALEFDEASLVARMVKVDVFLRTNRKDQAGEEIISALRRGLDLDLESKIPLDSDYVLLRINRLYAAERNRRLVGSRN